MSSPGVTAADLAVRLRAFDTPADQFEARLALAGRVAEGLRRDEPVEAALVVGSTALRRCSARADLDLVVIAPAPDGRDRFESRVVDGVRVEIERLGRSDALEATAGGGWVWELRQAARLGCGVAVLDTRGLAARLARRAAAMRPWPNRFEGTLRDVYLLVVELSRGGGDPARWVDSVRGCLDNLALLTLLQQPRRYQKPKWVLADLVDAGEHALVDAILAAYAVPADEAAAAHDAVTAGRDLVARVFDRAGLPSPDAVLAMGYAPAYAQASYVARCVDDADDLHASGRFVEAQYVARFGARLAAGLVGPGPGPGGKEAGVVDALTLRGDDLAGRYLALFGAAPEPDFGLLEVALATADARRDALRQPAATAADRSA